MEKSFATHSHVASIRSIASAKHYLASAGADDTVCLYDMRHRIESGKLMHHNGTRMNSAITKFVQYRVQVQFVLRNDPYAVFFADTINCIAFTPEASHLFTCSKDGSIAAIRCGNWQTEKLWRQAHKGSAVNTLAIHPTGKLALSTGADGVLRTWNLVKGRQAYAVNLVPRLKYDAKNVTIVKWSPNGEKYLLAVNQKIDVYSVEIAGIETELTYDSKIVCVEFLKDNLIAVGFEDGKIKFCDLRTSKRTLERAAHDIRVKCIAHMNDLLVSASSSGEIKLWRYNKHSLDMLQEINCGARITCLSLVLSCKDSVQQKEEKKLEEKKEIKKQSKFKLRQEVIVEDEGEREGIDVTNPKASKTKRKRKRVIEDAEDGTQRLKKKTVESKVADIPKKKKKKKRDRSEEQDDTDRPKKKKMLLKANEANVSSKKRKKNNTISEITLPAKRVKEASKVEQPPSFARKKHNKKHKLPATTDVEDAPPRKRKVKSLGEIAPRKKKRKDSKRKLGLD